MLHCNCPHPRLLLPLQARGTTVKTVGIIFHPLHETAGTLAAELAKSLEGDGVTVWCCSAWDGKAARDQMDGTDLIVSVGGDGTILRAAQAVVPRQTWASWAS